MRLFLALNLPAEVRRLAHEAAAPLRAAAATAHWVAETNLHLTLKFLGELPEAAALDVTARVREAAARHAEVSLELGGFGAFPNFRRPRVVWLGVTPDPKLELLHHDVEQACESLGFEVDGRAFRPHVTLGRVKLTAPPDQLRALANAARAAEVGAACTVHSVDLMRSELSAGGSRYAVLAALPLLSPRSL